MKYKLASSTWNHSETEAIQKVIASDMYSMGKKVCKYEDDFTKYIGSKYAVMTSSGIIEDSEYFDKNGLFIGNQKIDITENIRYLFDVINDAFHQKTKLLGR